LFSASHLKLIRITSGQLMQEVENSFDIM